MTATRATVTALHGDDVDLGAVADAFLSADAVANANTHRAYVPAIDRTALNSGVYFLRCATRQPLLVDHRTTGPGVYG